jgi:hypothetical protein
MREAAERQLRMLVDDMNGRYRVVDADAEVTRCLNADVVVEAFRTRLNLTPNRSMSEALTRDSLAELWDASSSSTGTSVSADWRSLRVTCWLSRPVRVTRSG